MVLRHFLFAISCATLAGIMNMKSCLIGRLLLWYTFLISKWSAEITDKVVNHLPLTNEQRAHDLALTALQAEINRQLISQLNGTNYGEDADFDIYQNYYSSYHQALEAFNLDFPEK